MRRKLLCLLAALISLTSEAATERERERERERIEIAGDYLQIALPAYAFGLSLFDDDDEAKWRFIKSFAATQATVPLKAIVQEKRPDGSNRASFPSGRSAAFIHRQYGIKEAVFPYAIAAFTAYSRVKAKKHYAHDTIARGAIAAAWTYFFTDKQIVVAPIEDGAIVNYRIGF